MARWQAHRPVTVTEIDSTLQHWQEQLAALAGRLLRLRQDPVRTAFAQAAAQPTGRTAVLLAPALTGLPVLFQQFGLLESKVAEASALRRALPSVFGRHERCQEIVALLQQPSIAFTPETVLPEQRAALPEAATTGRVAPEPLCGALAEALGRAEAGVAAVTQATERCQAALERCVDRWHASTKRAERLGRAGELPGLADRLREAEACARSDPFRALDMLENTVEPQLDAALSRLERVDRLAAGLRDAHRTLQALAELGAQFGPALDRVQARVCLAQVPGNPELEHARLAGWLARLEARRDEELGTLETGLRHWQAAAGAARAAAANAVGQFAAALDRRSELRGWLDALKSKARAFGAAEDPALQSLAATADALLYTRPADLTAGEAAVRRYEQQLSRQTAGRAVQGVR